MRAIDSVAPIKKVRVKANLDSELTCAVQIRGAISLDSRYKTSGWETDKDKCKISKIFLQKMLHRKESPYFEEKLVQNCKNPKELWNTLKSQGKRFSE